MASEGLVVLCAFLTLHVAFILNVTATGSTYWVEGRAVKNLSTHAREGLWQYCDEDHCGPIPSAKSAWFISVEVLYAVGAAVSLLATILYYMFCMTNSGRNSKRLIGFISILINLSWVILLTAVALYGARSTSAVSDLAAPRGLGWAYFVAVCGLVITFIAAICTTRELTIILAKRRAYIDL